MVAQFGLGPRLTYRRPDYWQTIQQMANNGGNGTTQPQQTTNWSQVPRVTETGAYTTTLGGNTNGTNPYPQMPGPWQASGAPPRMSQQQQAGGGDTWQYQPASATNLPGGAMEYQKAATQPATNLAQPTPTLGKIITGQAQPAANQQGLTLASTGSGGGAGWQGQDYRLPSGEVLPGNASFTLTMNNGAQVRLPGYYDPRSATGGQPQKIFMNGVYPEDAISRLQRRLNDAQGRGENINDPNVIFREMARVRDDALAVLGANATPAQLRAATGFVHLDRFVRGANGETGYTPGPGAPGPGGNTAVGAPPTVPASMPPPPQDPKTGGPGGTGPTATPTAPSGIITDDVVAQQVASDPSIAYAMLRAQQGKSGRDRSVFGDTRERNYGQAVQALAQLGERIDPASINAILSQVAGKLGGGGGIGSLLRGAGNAAMGRDMSTLGDTDKLRIMNALAGAQTYDMSPLWRAAVSNPLEDLQMLAIQQGAGNDTTGALTDDVLKSSNFWKVIQRLAAGGR